jgi:hypothetical protein
MSSKHQKYDDESKDRLHHDADDHGTRNDEEKHPAPKRRRKESDDDGIRNSTSRRDTNNSRSDRDSGDRRRSRSKSKSRRHSRRDSADKSPSGNTPLQYNNVLATATTVPVALSLASVANKVGKKSPFSQTEKGRGVCYQISKI